MLLALSPTTRLRATESLDGCTKRTVLPAPIEKLCQSAIRRCVVWSTVMVAPLVLMLPAPLTMVPPVGSNDARWERRGRPAVRHR